MAVYERSYKRYDGSITPQWSRFWVLTRYAFKQAFHSKLYIAFFAVSFLPALVVGSIIWLANNANILNLLAEMGVVDQLLVVDDRIFGVLMGWQYFFAFFNALIVGPGLVSKDLANNSLPLYLSRPFTPAEYVLGKLSVLAFLLSSMTWASCLILFLLQSSLASDGWMWEHASIAGAIIISSCLWVLTVSLLALALSAWVKWRPVAAFLMLMVFATGAFLGGLIDFLFKVEWGGMINLVLAIRAVWRGLLGLPTDGGVTPFLGWLALLALSAFSLFLLHRKVRAYEVVS